MFNAVFPQCVRDLLSEKPIAIFNKAFDMPLKLPKEMVDRDDDKPAFGGKKERGIERGSETGRFLWKIETFAPSEHFMCKIINDKFGMPLKLPKEMDDRDGDKPAFGGIILTERLFLFKP